MLSIRSLKKILASMVILSLSMQSSMANEIPSIDSLIESINAQAGVQSDSADAPEHSEIPRIKPVKNKTPVIIDDTDAHNGHYVHDESDGIDYSNIKAPAGTENYKMPVIGNVQIVLFSFKPKEDMNESFSKYLNQGYIGRGVLMPSFDIKQILSYFTYRGEVHMLDDYTSPFTYDKSFGIHLKNLSGDINISDVENEDEKKFLFTINVANVAQNVKGVIWTDDKTTVLFPIKVGTTHYICLLKIS